jgi:hypothetical protein
MATKVRFIVEKILGFLKNFEGLNNIRNTIAGHISIDTIQYIYTKDLEEMPLDSITDFPKIKKRILKRNFFRFLSIKIKFKLFRRVNKK